MLASWHWLLDDGSLQDGEPFLAGTAQPPVARISAGTAGLLGVADGDPLTVSAARGAITLPVAITQMHDGVVWVPTNSPGSAVRPTLGVDAGAVVRIAPASAQAGTNHSDTPRGEV